MRIVNEIIEKKKDLVPEDVFEVDSEKLPKEERDRILFTIEALVRDAKSRFGYAS